MTDKTKQSIQFYGKILTWLLPTIMTVAMAFLYYNLDSRYAKLADIKTISLKLDTLIETTNEIKTNQAVSFANYSYFKEDFTDLKSRVARLENKSIKP